MPDTTQPAPKDAVGAPGSLAGFTRRPEDARMSDNLPLERTSFVGRERELAEVKRLLSDRRLLTLCGPGGAGKTRLALAVARDAGGEFEGGAWWIELAPISDPELVARAAAQAVGVPEARDLSPTEALVEHLEAREALLILDNCEHLIEACAELADALLGSCPNLRLLASSREPLRVGGETNFVVPSLSVPDAGRSLSTEELAGYEAVRLFVERAGEADSGFALTEGNAPAVARLCNELDGIPLAIELAAARTRALSVEQILRKLEDPLGLLTTGGRTAAARHRTLRATLQWSYDLLGDDERALLRRLSVFVGGWTLPAAETVGDGGSVRADQVLDLLSALVDKSLVVAEDSTSEAEEPRYRMLEPVRQYAAELLEAGGGAEEVRRLHAAFYLGMAEEARPHLRTGRQVEWLERLEQENGNMRGALLWAHSTDDIAIAARMGWALRMFWWIRNRQDEGRRWTEPVFLRRKELPPPLRIRAILVFGAMVYGHGDSEALDRISGELVELSQEVGGDALAEANAHLGLGLVALHRGDFEAARQPLEEAMPLFRKAGEDGFANQTHTLLGTIRLLQGDLEGARLMFEEALALSRRLGDRMSIHIVLFNLAQLALASGNYDAAARRFAEGIAPAQELGDRGNVAHILEGLGAVAGARGEAVRSARLLGAAEALISAIGLRGHTYYQIDRSLYERINAGVRSALGEAAFEAALDEGRAMSPERAIEYALEEPTTSDEEDRTRSPAIGTAVRPEDASPDAGGARALRVFALGRARVERNGLSLDSPDWIHKSRELLYYLLSHPEGRTKEQIGVALWPEASASQLRSSFHDTVFRLRRALGGKEWVVFGKRRYAFGRSLPYTYDVEAFEKNLAEARRLQSEAPDQAVRHLQEAVGIYEGDFLEDLATEGEWAMERQEELRRAHGEALLLLGELLVAREGYAEAAEAYRKAITQDRYLEEAHRGLMRSQAYLGERGRALRHYEELAKLLEHGLGSSPDSETRALYERLRAGQEV